MKSQERDKAVAEPPGEPRQSQVGPVGRGIGGNSSIENLLAALGSRAGSRALTKAGTLAKLPAPHQLALREALLAASDSHKEAETTQGELAKIRKQLHQAEKDLSEKSQTSSKQSAEAAEQAFELKKDLAAAWAANEGYESRLRMRRVYVWMALAAGMAVAVAGAFLLPPMRPSVPPLSGFGPHGTPARAMPAASPALSAAPVASISGTAIPKMRNMTDEERALGRLDQDLAGLPLHEVAQALREANQWLEASGIPPCTVLSIEGNTSLLVTGRIKINGKRDGPLAGSLERCAEALEHVLK